MITNEIPEVVPAFQEYKDLQGLISLRSRTHDDLSDLLKETVDLENIPIEEVLERLRTMFGYNKLEEKKLALPSESTTDACFLQHYIESILALQEASCRLPQHQCETQIPLVIMTSDDTHSRTLDLLESNAYFSMKPTQVKLLKQVGELAGIAVGSVVCITYSHPS